MKEKLGLYKSPLDKRDFLVSPFLADVIERLPTEFDVTPQMSPIKHQGKEGACVGFAGVAVKEYHEKIDYGFTDDRYIDLSERFLYEESKKISGHSEGTTLVACAKVLVKLGVCEEDFWEYFAKDKRQSLPGAYHNALKFKVEPMWTRITNEKELKASLVKFGAIIIGVKVYNNWYKEKNGHIPDRKGWFNKLLGGHAICLVGYNDKTGEYKFKNSWGEGWGDNGYGYMSYKEMKKDLMDAICFIDIDDPNKYKNIPIETVGDLSFIKRHTAWV